MENYIYHTITQQGTAEFKDRGSRFLGYACPAEDAGACRTRIRALKQEHPKANHHCFAYRLGTDGLSFRCSDAGEPPGTAGRPILGQIDRIGVTNVLVVVVRYFGGTLLGVPGLIHAYRTTAALALQTTPLVTRNVEKRFRLSFNYTQMNTVMQVVRQYQCAVYDRQMELFCLMEVGVPLQHLDPFLATMKEMPEVELAAAP